MSRTRDKEIVIDPRTWVDPFEILPTSDEETTLQESIVQVADILESSDSGKCVCCGQTIKLYPRKFSNVMGKFLCKLVSLWKHRKSNKDWISIRRINKGEKASSDASYLVHWKLVKRGKVGLYRPTRKGEKFAKGLIRVPSHAFVYNGKFCLGLSNKLVSIDEVLGEKFNRNELLNTKWTK